MNSSRKIFERNHICIINYNLFRVRQPVTPERDVRDRLLLEDELDTEPDEEEIVSEEEEEDEDMEEGESGFISHAADTGLNIR